jgi:hypothetical protein
MSDSRSGHPRSKTADLGAPLRAVQAAMDECLITHGAYIPVELLLALGRLRYADYEAWRCGERPSLQAALAGNPRRVIELLDTAAGWAVRLGLRAEPQAYFGWGANAGARLTFLDPEWQASEELLATHYVRVKTQGDEGAQFDLFLDSGVTAALADLRARLRARDADGARRALDVLVSQEPRHSSRPAAGRLIDALAHLATPLPPAAAEAELRAIEQSLSPAARDILGADARDLLAPFWRRLAAALADVPFDAAKPHLHASHAYACALDWPRVIASIEAAPGHAEQPMLLVRLAAACRLDGDRDGAIAAWCALCLLAPDAAADTLDAADLPDIAVREAWRDFLELDAEPSAVFFPAFLLLMEPGLARSLPETFGRDAGAGEHAFRAMRALLRADDTEARRAVRAAAPWLLEAYLDARASRFT